MRDKLVVELCMGSSCFARGNSSTLGELENFIERNALEDKVELVGHLCLSGCSSGPHIIIGGQNISGVSDPAAVLDLLRRKLEASGAQSDIH